MAQAVREKLMVRWARARRSRRGGTPHPPSARATDRLRSASGTICDAPCPAQAPNQLPARCRRGCAPAALRPTPAAPPQAAVETEHNYRSILAFTAFMIMYLGVLWLQVSGQCGCLRGSMQRGRLAVLCKWNGVAPPASQGHHGVMLRVLSAQLPAPPASMRLPGLGLPHIRGGVHAPRAAAARWVRCGRSLKFCSCLLCTCMEGPGRARKPTSCQHGGLPNLPCPPAPLRPARRLNHRFFQLVRRGAGLVSWLMHMDLCEMRMGVVTCTCCTARDGAPAQRSATGAVQECMADAPSSGMHACPPLRTPQLTGMMRSPQD